MDRHSDRLKANSCSDYHLNWVVAFEPEKSRRGKENDCKRNKTQHNLHPLENLLPQDRNLNIILKL